MSCVELAAFMGGFNVNSSHYAISWVLTLFAHDVSQDLLLTLWDQYIYYRNPVINIFTAVQHIISNRERILSIHSEDVVMILSKLPFENDNHSCVVEVKDGEVNVVKTEQSCNPTIITSLVSDGIQLMQQTPPSFIRQLNNLVNMQMECSKHTLDQYARLSSIITTPSEIATFLLRGVENNKSCLHYLLIDTRDYGQFKRHHLTSSKNLSATAMLDLHKLDYLVRQSNQHHYHLAILEEKVGLRPEEDSCGKLIEELQRRGCQYVSRVVGGFEAVCAFIQSQQVNTTSVSLLIRDSSVVQRRQ